MDKHPYKLYNVHYGASANFEEFVDAFDDLGDAINHGNLLAGNGLEYHIGYTVYYAVDDNEKVVAEIIWGKEIVQHV